MAVPKKTWRFGRVLGPLPGNFEKYSFSQNHGPWKSKMGVTPIAYLSNSSPLWEKEYVFFPLFSRPLFIPPTFHATRVLMTPLQSVRSQQGAGQATAARRTSIATGGAQSQPHGRPSCRRGSPRTEMISDAVEY